MATDQNINPAKVNTEVKHVVVEGLVKTKGDIVARQIWNIIKATNLYETLNEIKKSTDNLKQLNVFKDKIMVTLRKSKVEGSDPNKSYIDIEFKVEEKKRFTAGVAAQAGNQSGDASVNFSLRNTFGRAEEVKITTSTQFPHWGQTFQLNFMKPLTQDIRKRIFLSVGTSKTDHPFSGYQQQTTDASFQLVVPSWLGEHYLGWSVDWRELFGFSNTVPLSIREQGGHSLKSSVKHMLIADTRDCAWNPHSGYVSRLTQELAGLGGNVSFGKMEIQTDVFNEIYSELTTSFSFWGGLLKPFNCTSCISDRFFLGGPTTVRGFGMWGLGPRERDWSVGGEAYWAVGSHLYVPLPVMSWLTGQHLKGHGFVNAGNLISTDIKELKDLGKLRLNPRLSIGSGLILRVGIATIELNYVWPIWYWKNDKLMSGFQVGVGLEML